MSVFRQLLMQKANEPKAWRNFAENPAAWGDLNTAWMALAEGDFEFSIDYINFGNSANSTVIPSLLYIMEYGSTASQYVAYSGNISFSRIASAVTAKTENGVVFSTGLYALLQKTVYPQNTRRKIIVSKTGSTVAVNIDGMVTSTVITDKEWTTPAAGSININGNIFSAVLKDKSGNIVWSAPMSELKA